MEKQNNDNKIIITEISNGWVLNIPTYVDGGRAEIGAFSYKESDDIVEIYAESLAELLRYLVDFALPIKSREKYDIKIDVIKK